MGSKSTSLHPAHPSEAAVIVSAITDPVTVITKAKEFRDAGEVQLRCH